MNDVARAAGVGTMTVSRVLNGSPHVSEKTAERVRAAVAQLGYHPNEMARALRNSKSRTIGLLVPNLYDPFYATCAHAFNMVAKENDYTVLLTITNENPEHEYSEAQRMLQRHVEGLGVIAANPNLCRMNTPEFREIPVVALDRPLPIVDGISFDSVITENEVGCRLAMEHLLEHHGIERVFFAGHKPGLYTMQRRLEACAEAVEKAGFAIQSTFECTSEERAFELIRAAMESPEPPQAIFSANNLATRHILFALLRLGLRVPEDIALIGFDDLELGDLLHPALTVVRQPVLEIGLTAGRILFSKLRKEVALRDVTNQVLPVELIVRHSCGCSYEAGQPR